MLKTNIKYEKPKKQGSTGEDADKEGKNEAGEDKSEDKVHIIKDEDKSEVKKTVHGAGKKNEEKTDEKKEEKTDEKKEEKTDEKKDEKTDEKKDEKSTKGTEEKKRNTEVKEDTVQHQSNSTDKPYLEGLAQVKSLVYLKKVDLKKIIRVFSSRFFLTHISGKKEL
jgi:hypothetical protein